MLKTTLMLISVGAVGASYFGLRPQVAPAVASGRKNNDLRVSADNAARLQVNIPLGDVTLIADNSRSMTVHVERSAKPTTGREAQRWMNDSYLTAETHGGVLEVRDHPFGKNSLNDLHTDSDERSGRGGKTFDLHVQIHAPEGLAAKFEVGAGNGDIRGQFRSMDASILAGNLTVNGLRCQGPTKLNVGAGNLKESLDGPSRGSSSLHVGAGEAKLVIPSGAGADVSADVSMGDIVGLPGTSHKKGGLNLGDRRHGRTGSGDAKVDIHVGAGSIKVESSERVEASTMPEEEAASESDSKFEFSFDDKDFGDVKDLQDLKELKGLKDMKDLKDLDKLDITIRDSVREAMKEVQKSMAALPLDLDIKIDDAKFDKVKFRDLDMGDMEEIGQIDKETAKALADIVPTVERAMREAKPEIEKAMRQMKPEVEKAMRAARVEIEKAMRDMKRVKPEVERALRQAMEEVRRALKEMEKSEKVHSE